MMVRTRHRRRRFPPAPGPATRSRCPAPPHSSGTSMPSKPSSRHLLQRLARESGARGPSAAAWGQALAREVAHGVADHLLFLRSASSCGPSDQFDRHRRGFAAADAQAGDAALAAVLAQRAEQRHQDARARGADRMAQRAGAAVDVDLVVRQMPSSCIAAMVTTAKASLISNRSTSPRRPAGLLEQLLRSRRPARW